MNNGPRNLVFSRRHLVRSLIRLMAVAFVVLAILPLLTAMLAELLRGFPGRLADPINYLRYQSEDQTSFLLIMGGLAIVLWLLQERLARLIVPRIARACPECGYELKRLTSRRCPECGVEIPKDLINAEESDS